MAEQPTLDRQQALKRLAALGITGKDVYLVDLVPLLEMVWADGRAQSAELTRLDAYLKGHVERINALAGYALLSVEEAQRFVMGFLRERPPAGLLEQLRSLVAAARLSSSDSEVNRRLKDSLLVACLEIAASEGPSGAADAGERFAAEEKRCFFEILEALDGVKPGSDLAG